MAPIENKSKSRSIKKDENRSKCPDQTEEKGMDKQQNITNRI